MPIQITELNISVSVTQPGSKDNVPASSPAVQHAENIKMVEECVEQVMKVLQDKKER